MLTSASTIWMTGDTVIQIGKSLVTGIVLYPGMALVASVSGESSWMAGLAVAVGSAVVHREGMRAIEAGGQPGSGGMASAAVGAEQSLMDGRFGMAGAAGGRGAFEDIVGVAAGAGYTDMRASQGESRFRVVE